MAKDIGRELADLLYTPDASDTGPVATNRMQGLPGRIVGGGVRGAALRALFGLDPAEDSSAPEMDVYRNVQAMTMTPTPLALAAAPAALLKGKKAAAQAAKAAETTKKVSTNAAPLTPLQSIQQGGYKIPPGGLSSEDKAALRPLYNQGLVKVEERGQEKFIVPGRGAWFEFATPEQKKALDQFQVAQNLKDLSFMGPTESLLNSAQASFYDFEISPGVRSIPIKMFEPFIGGYDSVHESKRIQDLTRAIQQSKQIEPLFVGLDPTGEPYIMEGQHRVRALKALGYDQIPARVVVDMDDITKAKGGAVSKRGGKVSITDNLDTMRLAVQKRK